MKVELDLSEREKGEHFIVYVFVHRIAMPYGMTSDHSRVKFGVDFGQCFLKATLTLTDASLHCAGEQNSSLNGGKKTMLLAVFQVPETLFTLLNAPGDLNYVYACDLTVINMATGLSSHSSRQPCPYCTSRSTQWDPDAPLRTISMNAEHQHL